MSKVIIESVEQVIAPSARLREINRYWSRFPMQIITTDKGVFIDHKEGSNAGHWRGAKYEVGTEYEYENMTDNNGAYIVRDEPVLKDNIWLRPIVNL